MKELTEIEICQCSSLEHQVIFQFDPDEGYNDFLYINVALNHYYPWYKRIWLGIKYMFGYECRFGHYDEIMLNREGVTRIRDRFNAVLKKMPK